MATDTLVKALAQTADAWCDPDHEHRVQAVRSTTDANPWFTEEAVVFAINQQVSQIDEEFLLAWREKWRAERSVSVSVIGAGNVPFVDFQDFLAVLLAGHRFIGKSSSQSSYLLPAFAEDLGSRIRGLDIRFAEGETVFDAADLLIASGSDASVDAIARKCDAYGIEKSRRLLRGHGYGAAVIGGHESAAERSALAEDILLHEGRGCRNVGLIWAPRNCSPDPYLDMMAQFREIFPPASNTAGALKMQEAFLRATGQPHAAGPGFLVSKGPPEVQAPGHVRWTEYSEWSDVTAWLERNREQVQLLVVSDKVADHLPDITDKVSPGNAQRPHLTWNPGGVNARMFLKNGGC